MAMAEKQAAQIGVESVASARQSNQKDILIAKRVQIDLTYDAVREKLEVRNSVNAQQCWIHY